MGPNNLEWLSADCVRSFCVVHSVHRDDDPTKYMQVQ